MAIDLPSGYTLGDYTYRNLAAQVLKNTEDIASLLNNPFVLPEVSELDNGKILQVLNGEWAKSSGLTTLAATVTSIGNTVIQSAADIAILQSQMNDIIGDLITLTATLTAINQGAVDLEEE